MVKSKQPAYRKKGKLTLFGKYFEKVCQKLHVSWEQLAKEAGLSPSTIAKMTTENGNSPRRSTLERLTKVMRQRKEWQHTYKTGLYNLAGFATEEQMEEARRHLVYFDYVDEKKDEYPEPLPNDREKC